MKNYMLPLVVATAAALTCASGCDWNGGLRLNAPSLNIAIPALSLVSVQPPPANGYRRSDRYRHSQAVGTRPGGLTPAPRPATGTPTGTQVVVVNNGTRPAAGTPAAGTPAATPAAGETGDAVPTVSQNTLFGGPTGDDDALLGEIFYIAKATTKIPDFATLMSSGILFTPELNIPPNEFTTGFPGVDPRSEFFAIRYEGPLTVTNPGVYDFRLISDDGARMYINNTLVIDNDGVHASAEKLGRVDLAAGVNVIRVEYLQAQGPRVALQLFVKSDKLTERPLRGKL